MHTPIPANNTPPRHSEEVEGMNAENRFFLTSGKRLLILGKEEGTSCRVFEGTERGCSGTRGVFVEGCGCGGKILLFTIPEAPK